MKNYKYNIYSISIKRVYSTHNNIKRNAKHYPTANKEWKESIYSYNKNYLKSLFIHNNTASNFIKSHFHITNLKNIARSKRMRNLIIKKSSKKIFVSKPYVKHNSDKVIINIYTYNRQKEFITRKLFFFKRKYELFKYWFNNPIIKNIYLKKNILKKRYLLSIIKKGRTWIKKKNNYIPFHGIKYKNELDYLKYRTSDIYKKFFYLNNVFIFMFFRKLLSLFNINLLMPFYESNKNIYKSIDKLGNIIYLNKKSKKLELINKNNISENHLRKILFNYNYNYQDLIFFNKHILYYIEKRFINTGIINESDIISMYITFKTKYYVKFINKFFRESHDILYYLKSLELNNLKYTKLLKNLKILIARVYSKKTELNIINLKYPFLNSDIYSNIIANKAIKKLSFLRVLKSSLTLSKIPKKINFTKREDLKPNNYKYINYYKKLSLNNLFVTDNKDKLNYIFTNIYPNHYINKKLKINENKKDNSKIINILNILKFKWVSGVWLQGAGRLTRRYTAARSALIIRHKGSLKNKQYRLENNILKSLSTTMIRNTEKSNSQYGFTHSKRRIGSFGIKSWISSY